MFRLLELIGLNIEQNDCSTWTSIRNQTVFFLAGGFSCCWWHLLGKIPDLRFCNLTNRSNLFSSIPIHWNDIYKPVIWFSFLFKALQMYPLDLLRIESVLMLSNIRIKFLIRLVFTEKIWIINLCYNFI